MAELGGLLHDTAIQFANSVERVGVGECECYLRGGRNCLPVCLGGERNSHERASYGNRWSGQCCVGTVLSGDRIYCIITVEK